MPLLKDAGWRIVENSNPQPIPILGTIRLTVTKLTVVENASPAVIQLQRSDGDDGAVSVLVNTVNGSAVAGDDYTRVQKRRIQWADGESAIRTVNISLNNDAITEAGGENSGVATLSLRRSSGAVSVFVTCADVSAPPVSIINAL
ncbi:MAG: hypothetical protein ACJAQ6_000900 [Arenicella sp.]|jgi:hypothetical protein